MYGYEIDAPPSRLDGCRVLMRLIDGLAFRFYWATEGLRSADHEYRPGADSMNAGELIEHVLQLTRMIRQTITNADAREPIDDAGIPAARERALTELALVREHLAELEDEGLAGHGVLKRNGERYPVWHIINGPIADALTHVGQINAWRRLSGNPPRRANVFLGTPPDE